MSDTWDLSKLFSGDDDPRMDEGRKAVEERSRAFVAKWKERDDYLSDPVVLREALDEYAEWSGRYATDGDEGYYFWLRTQQDQNDTALKAKFNKVEERARKIQNDMQFFHLRIGKIPAERQAALTGHPGLQKYRHYLERIFDEARFLLSEPEERIMNLKSATSYGNWVRMTSGFLSREERTVTPEDGVRQKKSFSEILSLMNSKKRKSRDSAAQAFNDILRCHVDVAEAELNSILANKKIDDELRGVSRPDLTRHVSDDIESDTVDALVEAVSSRFDIPSRFYEFKARIMGVGRLRYHERNVEYGEVTRKYPRDEAFGLMEKVLASLDAEFLAIFRRFADQGHFDIFPRKGKASGAFCAHNLISQPTYILLNHTDTLNDVLTVAHELGHGINNELIRGRQHALYFGTPLSTAEAASTFLEDFVLREILADADDDLRLAIMMKKLSDDISTIFRQIACYRFEQELHRRFREEGYLSKKNVGALFRKHMRAYMGPCVEQSRGSENWWVYWGHIRSFFYVYSYASGLLISKSLQNAVKDDPQFIGKVKEFLAAGLSDSPMNIFLKLGIDISDPQFWGRGISEVESLLNETMDLARRLGRV